MTARAYMRADPEMFARKVVHKAYTAPQFAAFVAVLCLAEEQPQRGRFRTERLLRLLLDDPIDSVHLGWGKHVPFLVEHGDLIRQPDGSLYLDGWDEWQEGDVTVKDRMARLRDRRRRSVTPPVTPDVTAGVTEDTVTIPSRATTRAPSAVAVAVSNSRSGDGPPVTEPHDDRRERSNARHMAYLRGDITAEELEEMRIADAVPVKRPQSLRQVLNTGGATS